MGDAGKQVARLSERNEELLAEVERLQAQLARLRLWIAERDCKLKPRGKGKG